MMGSVCAVNGGRKGVGTRGIDDGLGVGVK